MWVKRGKIGSEANPIFAWPGGNTLSFGINFNTSNQLEVIANIEGIANRYRLQTTQVFRDTSAWYHLVLASDTSQLTESDRLSVYINGSKITSFGISNYPSIDFENSWNNTILHGIGYNNYFDGYLAEIYNIDGQALTPSAFGETDSITGRWKAKAFTGTYGVNGFYLPFSNTTTGSNSVLTSEDFSVAMYQKDGITVTTNATTAPNGALTADELVETSTTSNHRFFFNNQTHASGVTYTTSVYVKANTRSVIALENWNTVNATYCVADLSNGTITAGSDASARITSVGNGWYRVSVSNVGNGGTTGGSSVYIKNNTALGGFVYSGNGSSVYVWGMQTEASSTVGPYLPTNGTAFGSSMIFSDASVSTGGYNNWVANNLSVTPGTGNDSLTDSPSNYGAISTTLVADTYQIGKSLRFNSADSAYLNRTLPSSGNLTTWTWSGWVKPTKMSAQEGLFYSGNGVNIGNSINFTPSNQLEMYYYTSAYVWRYVTTQAFRDPTSWYHIVGVYDSGNATQADRVRLYVNGVRITSFSISTAVSTINQVGSVNNSSYTHYFGSEGAGNFFNGYLAELNFIDGQALDPSSFGTRDINTYLWKPKAYTGTYGTNGFYLPFTVPTETAFAAYLSDASTNYNTLPGGNQGENFRFSGDFTIEGWVKYTSQTSGDTSLYVQEVLGGGQYFAFNLSMFDGVYNIYLNSAQPTASITHGISANEWAHVAMVRSGSTISLYTNGALRGTINNNSSILGYTNMTVNNRFGGGLSGVARSMSNFRITKSAVYTSRFTPPTTALTNIPNTLVLTYQNSTAIDNSSNNFSMGTVGAVSFSVDSPFNINSAVALDRSGGGNSWVANNLSLTEGTGNDSLVDSPTFYPSLSTTLTDDTYQISRSLRFTTADLSHLSRTFPNTGNRKTWTWSGWVKRSALNSYQRIFTSISGNLLSILRFNPANQIEYWDYSLTTSTPINNITTSQIIRDVSSWYHIVCSVDTNSLTAANRYRVFVNGVQVNQFASQTTTQSFDTAFNAAVTHYLGDPNETLNAYLAEVNFIDGQSLIADNFGIRDTKTYAWKPKAYAGTYGTNGFYLPFLDDSGATATTLGKDNSTYRMLTAQLNGTSNGIQRGADLTGIANGKSGIVSMWCNFTAGASGDQNLWSSRNNLSIGNTLNTYRGIDGKIWVSAMNSAGTTILAASTVTNVVATSGLYHIYIAWDLNVNNQVKVYVNGVNQALAITTFTNATIQYSVPNHGFGGFLYNPFIPTTPVMVGQLYVNYSTYLDPVTNISKFYNAGKPVSLGASGEIPTGSPPIVYLDGNATTILTNRGTGGNFAAYGTLATGTTYEGVGSHYNNWTPNNFSVTEGTGDDSLVDSPTYYGTLSTTPSEDTYQISRSLRLKGTNTTLSRAVTVEGNRRTWTWSAWVKRSKLGVAGDPATVQQLFSRNDLGGTSNYTYLYFLDDNSIQFLDSTAGSAHTTSYLTTKTKFTDTTNWYHIVLAVDTQQVIDTHRVKLYVNGTLMTSFTSVSWPGRNNQTQIGTVNTHYIGSNRQNSQFFSGYLAEVNHIDGLALGADSFGVREAGTYLWKPKAYTGAYGTNGFSLKFSDSSTKAALGTDSSGLNNTYDVEGSDFSVATGTLNAANNDSFIDVPTYYGTDNGAGGEARGSYSTWNPLATTPAAPVTFSNGNLDVSFGSSLTGRAQSTLGVSSGKWYAEITVTAASGIDRIIGIVTPTTNDQPGYTADSYGYYGNGQKITNNTLTNYGASYTTNDVIGIALDLDAGTITFYKNNTSQGQAFSGLSGTYLISVSDSSNAGTCSYTANFGQRAFRYAAPTGFKALRDFNKPPVQTGGELRGDYCTLDPLSITSGTFTNGNLRYAGPGDWRRTNSTMSMSAGKWYYEVTLANAPYPGRTASTTYNGFGFSLSNVTNSSTNPGSATDALVLFDSGFFKNFAGATTDGGTAFLAGDVLSVSVDLDANTFVFRRNNIPITSGTIGGTPGRSLTPCILSYSDQYGVMDVNFGQRPWAFGAPLGFSPLRDYNKPAIQTGGELRGDYATCDPINKGANTVLTDGNLRIASSGTGAGWRSNQSIPRASGKWYWEVTIQTVGTGGTINHVTIGDVNYAFNLSSGNFLFYRQDGYIGGTLATPFSNGSVIGVALDADASTVSWYHNGILQLTSGATIYSTDWLPGGLINSVGGVSHVNFGQRQYVYPPPFGFRPLRDYNKLPTPTGGEVRGNYATLNPLFGNTGGTITDGNLRLTHTGGGNGKNALGVSSVAVSSGKWYGEFTNTAAITSDRIGIISSANTSIVTSGNPYFSQYSDGYSAYVGGGTYKENNNITTTVTNFGGSAPVAGDVYMVALDMDNNKVWFGRNGSWANNGNPNTGLGETYSILSGRSYYFACNTYLGDQLVANFGQRPWAYDAPFGFKPLCTTLLPQPIIQKSSTAMDVVTYTGTATGNTISGFGFSPDLVWIKSRSGNTNHNIFDTIRGATAGLVPNLLASEYSDVGTLAVFNTNGFTLGGDGSLRGANHNLNTYVAWAWDAGSSSVTNTSGSIASTVRANPQAGVSIVSYTGNGTTGSVGHSLGLKPSFIIVKNRSVALGNNWGVYHSSLTASQYIYLNLTNAASTSGASTAWGNNSSTIEPTSSVFTVGNSTAWNGGGNLMIAYCFAEVEGFSKFGSYTGNGSPDGPFVYCGFRPRWIMYKRSGTGTSGNWNIIDAARDTYNPEQTLLRANLDILDESNAVYVQDFTANGWKIRSTNVDINVNDATYIFAAFAESPFKYARAR